MMDGGRGAFLMCLVRLRFDQAGLLVMTSSETEVKADMHDAVEEGWKMARQLVGSYL